MYEKPTKVVGRRVAAFLIDLVITYAFNALVFLPFSESRSAAQAKLHPGESVNTFVNIGDKSIIGGGKVAVFLLITLAFGIAYWVILQGIKGWTPGKLALGIRTVDAEGRPPGIGKAFVRQFMWIADSFPWFIPYIVGFVTALATEKNQRVGDLVAKTFVVKKEAAGRPPFGGGAPGGGFAQPAYGTPAPAGGYPPQPPQPAVAAGQKADWYPDPQGKARLRYWDGSNWTDNTSE
ncbi:MAG: hypothetical protein QOJ07_2186 [Thermoleophilaceae bacterium]|nr:hypothetical protein [Thermoleophilaceae bacterium]